MPITSNGRRLNLIILNSYSDLKSKKLAQEKFPSISDVIHMQDVRALIKEIEEMEVKDNAEIKQEG